MIGYSVRSAAMGGADVAVDADCSGSSCNPATQGKNASSSLALGLSTLMPQLSFMDTQNTLDGEDQLFPLPYMSYVHWFDNSAWTAGINLYAQGGMGVDFREVETFAGTSDSIESQVNYMRMTGTATYQVNDKLSLGAGLMVGYADIQFALFPNTYSAGRDNTPGTMDDFMGMDVDDLGDYGVAGRIGLQYRLTDKLNLGFQYTSEAVLDPDGGTMTLNFGDRRVKYDAEMNDFTWPRELEVGLAARVTPQLLLAADIKWLNWSSAIKNIQLQGSNPDIPVPLSSPDLQFTMNWKDQWVFALGVEYTLFYRHILRTGYNYGQNPVPDANLTPLFPAITEHHLSLGYGYKRKGWAIDVTWEHAFENSQTNSSPGPPADPDGIANPFAPGPTVSHAQNTIHAVVTWYF